MAQKAREENITLKKKLESLEKKLELISKSLEAKD